MKDAAVNSTPGQLVETLKSRGWPVRSGMGGDRNFNRVQLDWPQPPPARCSPMLEGKNSQSGRDRHCRLNLLVKEGRLCRSEQLGFPGSSPRKIG